MAQDWSELIKFTHNEDFVIEKIRLKQSDVTVEGEFELPPLSKLSNEDQIFIIAFLKTHGNIRDMEELFGISYPSVKNRLNKISKKMEFVEVNPPAERNEILDQLYKGEISVEEALEKLGGER
ncbi:DUF2089 domain-containing protein [bacterium]|nr:DUF2089 domain-containing protein [bacterium]